MSNFMHKLRHNTAICDAKLHLKFEFQTLLFR
uniref:Uncharacterized protein n=1 Tax=Siphoviridae sp. ctOCb13 TaxID=2825477 RepID=A0A8S5Q2G9_9CAUD|nr:MAG TPA: hypothetical protein [Siphoviridae sp. ctOCb13]